MKWIDWPPLLTFKISAIKPLTWKDEAIAAVQPIPHPTRNGFFREDKHGRCTRSRRHRHRPHGTSIKVMVWSDKWWPQSTRNITQPVQTQRGIYDTWSVRSQVARWEAKAKAPAIIRRPIGKVMCKSSRPLSQLRVLSGGRHRSARGHRVSGSAANQEGPETRKQLRLGDVCLRTVAAHSVFVPAPREETPPWKWEGSWVRGADRRESGTLGREG